MGEGKGNKVKWKENEKVKEKEEESDIIGTLQIHLLVFKQKFEVVDPEPVSIGQPSIVQVPIL